MTRHLYCIEGHWDYEDERAEPTVEPILRMVETAEGWPWIRRNSATVSEMHHWLATEWWERCANGSILYIASHGEPGKLWLSNREVEALSTLADRAEKKHFAERCLVHFGGCAVLDISDDEIDAFLDRSGAYAVSGYTRDAGWIAESEDEPPAVALELMLFGSICRRDINLGNHAQVQAALPRLERDINERFPACGFRLRTRPEALPR